MSFISWVGSVVSSEGFIAAGFGAIAGAMVASRGTRRAALTMQFNSIRASIGLCFSITSQFMSFQKHTLGPVAQQYQEEIERHEHFKVFIEPTAGPKNPVLFHLQAHLVTLPVPVVDTGLLTTTCFQGVGVTGRALAAVVTLCEAIRQVELHSSSRNELIRGFLADNPDDEQLIARYLGLVGPDANVDERFRHSLDGMVKATVDCVFFAKLLHDDLADLARRRRRASWLRLRFGLPRIDTVDWSDPDAMALLPKEEEYRGWLRGFRKRRPVRDGLNRLWIGVRGGKRRP